MKETRVLPADVYDALELSAEAFGGIGAGAWCDGIFLDDGPPRCLVGHAWWVGAIPSCEFDELWLLDAMRCNVGDLERLSDGAVQRINRRMGSDNVNARVSFADYCAELGIVRGDQ